MKIAKGHITGEKLRELVGKNVLLVQSNDCDDMNKPSSRTATEILGAPPRLFARHVKLRQVSPSGEWAEFKAVQSDGHDYSEWIQLSEIEAVEVWEN